jgi:hypothetical protein
MNKVVCAIFSKRLFRYEASQLPYQSYYLWQRVDQMHSLAFYLDKRAEMYAKHYSKVPSCSRRAVNFS